MNLLFMQAELTDHEKEAFLKIAGDDGEIDAFELQQVLNEELKEGEWMHL